jgi:hypothetical protein
LTGSAKQSSFFIRGKESWIASGASAPGIPHALRGGSFLHNSGASRRGNASVHLWKFIEFERATLSTVIVREGGRSSIPETPAMESKGRCVLDTPTEPVIGLAKGETRWRGMTTGDGGAGCAFAAATTG